MANEVIGHAENEAFQELADHTGDMSYLDAAVRKTLDAELERGAS